MNKKTAAENRNDFLHAVNSRIYSEGRNVININKHLGNLNVDSEYRLNRNVNEEYRRNVMDTNERLKNCGIEFFGGQFCLRKLYQEELISYVDSAINAYNQLTKKVNKIVEISHKFPRIIDKLAKRKFFDKFLIEDIKEYNNYTNLIISYRVEEKLIELLERKYDAIDPAKVVSDSVYVAFALDLNVIKKMGLVEKYAQSICDIAKLVCDKENDILKQKETGEKEKVKTIEKNGE